MTLVDTLTSAARVYGLCARALQERRPATGFPPHQYEQVVGIGIAADWIGWTYTLTTLNFRGRRQRSDRVDSMTQLTRFSYLWTAANAVFGRPALLKLVDATAQPKSELERFRLLARYAGLPSAGEAACLRTLHGILELPMKVQDFPWLPAGRTPLIFEVIYYKYMTATEQNRPLGRKLLAASQAGSLTAVDLPSLIYATRNWNVHGVLLSSSFRGTRKKFEVYINTVVLALARILDGTGKNLLRGF